MNKYNPKEYWGKRKDPTPNIVPEWVYKYIFRYLAGETVLDFGAGDGRLFPLYIGMKVTAFDIVDTYKERAWEKAQRSGLKSYEHVSEVKGQFDTVVCSKVFLHMPPDNFTKAWDFVNNIGKRVIVWDGLCQQSDHTFKHDYCGTDFIIKGDEIIFYRDNG